MPANLPPDYFEAEKRYRSAGSIPEKIACLEEMLSIIPKHKGTDHLRADLRRRLSKLKTAPRGKKGTSKRESAYHIDREGAGQVVLVGPANVGKSALVAALTHATPEVASHPYATWVPSPGMMPVDNVQIQLIDTPSLRRDYVEPELIDLIKRSELILLVVDLQAYPIQQLEDAVATLEEHRIAPDHRRDRAPEPEGLRMTYLPLLVVVNKNDDEGTDEDLEVLRELLGEEWNLLPISAITGRHVERFKQAVFERLGIIRIYARPPGREPDFSAPFVMERGSTVEDFADKVHHDFAEKLKSARVWGSGAFEGQMVGRDHVLQEGDIVELRI
jgi:ribosome-interacting GTPase 1